MKKEKKTSGWEERFDKELIPIDWLLYAQGERPCGDRGIDLLVAKFHSDRIKAFIREELLSTRAEAIEEVIEIIKNSRTVEEHYGVGIRETTARNQILMDLLVLSKKEI